MSHQEYKFVAVKMSASIFQPSDEKSMTHRNRLVTNDMWTAKQKYTFIKSLVSLSC